MVKLCRVDQILQPELIGTLRELFIFGRHFVRDVELSFGDNPEFLIKMANCRLNPIDEALSTESGDFLGNLRNTSKSINNFRLECHKSQLTGF